ncbi:hypothetical protein [Streptomyces sp. OK228]|uniref:hypothetical protein n=1 Tax=Streptomyces sp. OK228 TaxID=1882786 RepID=UPI0015CF0F54|nr:hypothetical protein [Streptomyces sp. OK228]
MTSKVAHPAISAALYAFTSSGWGSAAVASPETLAASTTAPHLLHVAIFIAVSIR